MVFLDDVTRGHSNFKKVAEPTAPVSGEVRVFADSTGTLQVKADDGSTDQLLTLADAKDQLFTPFRASGNLWRGSFNPVSIEVLTRSSGGATATVDIVTADMDDEFRGLGIDKFFRITYPAGLTAAQNRLITIRNERKFAPAVPGETVTVGMLVRLNTNNITQIVIGMYDTANVYMGSTYSQYSPTLTTPKGVEHLKVTFTIPAGAGYITVYLNNATGNASPMVLDMIGWYIVEGAGPTAWLNYNADELTPAQDLLLRASAGRSLNLNTGHRTGGASVTEQGATKTWVDNDGSGPLATGVATKYQRIDYTGTGINVFTRLDVLKTLTKFSMGAWIKKDLSGLTLGLGVRVTLRDSLSATVMDMRHDITQANLFEGYQFLAVNGGKPYAVRIQKEYKGWLYVSVEAQELPAGVVKASCFWQPNTSVIAAGVTGHIEIMDWAAAEDGTILHYVEYPETTGPAPQPWLGKRYLLIGDSITAVESRWVSSFNAIMKPSSYVNVAVSGATWRDKVGTVYDGNPVLDGADGNKNNVLGNQLQKVLNNAYAAPDVIIIAAGTNDASVETADLIEAQFTSGESYITLGSVDRKTFAGAMRYVVETLQTTYPNAQIFIGLPIQGAEAARSYAYIKARGDLMSLIAHRLAVPIIHAEECGIYGAFETESVNGRDLADGLHPNTSGAAKLARYMAMAIKNWYL